MNKNPKVTVLLSSYNHEKFIRDSIDSILLQTFKDFEFYILDDCSEDSSWEIIQSYNDNRIISIRNESNTNFLDPKIFKKFKGKYLAMAHCDDLWAPDKLEEQVKYLDANENVAVCFTDVQLIDQDDNVIVDENHYAYNLFNSEPLSRLERIKLFITFGNHLCHPSSLIRLEVQFDLNLFTYGMGSLPDAYRWLKILINGWDIYVLQKKLTYFRIHKNGKTASGINFEHGCRGNKELFFIADEFYHISTDDLKILVRMFDYKGKYETRTELEFILSKILLDTNFPGLKICALKKIYLQLNNTKSRKILYKKFNFGHKEFLEITSQDDIFHIFPDNCFISTSLYYSTQSIFLQEKSTQKCVFVAIDYFEVSYDLRGTEYDMLRFDPDEGQFRKFWDMHFYIDGKETEFKPIGVHVKRDKKIYFYTTDPIFISDKLEKSPNKIKITGRTSVLPNSEIEKLIDKKANWIPPMGRKKALKFALTGKK